MASKIQVRRGTDAQWTAENPVLALGEFGYVTDLNALVIGDGTTPYVETEFASVPKVAMFSDLMGLASSVMQQISDLNIRVTFLEGGP